MLPKLDLDNHLKCVYGEIMWCATNYKPLHNLGLTYLTGTTHFSELLPGSHSPDSTTAMLLAQHSLLGPIQIQLLPKSRFTSLSLNTLCLPPSPRAAKTLSIMNHFTFFSNFFQYLILLPSTICTKDASQMKATSGPSSRILDNRTRLNPEKVLNKYWPIHSCKTMLKILISSWMRWKREYKNSHIVNEGHI